MNWETMFDNTTARESEDFGPIAQGEYRGFFYMGKLDESKDVPRVSIQWRIVTKGEFQNRHVFSNYQLNEQGIPFLKEDLKTLGIPNVTAKTLTTSLESLNGTEATIFIKPKKVGDKLFYGVYVREKLGKSEFDMNEEIPF